MDDAAPAKSRKKRPPPKTAHVDAIERVTPNLIRIVCSGPELAAFTPPKPAAHIKLLFPPPSMNWPPAVATEDAPRPPSRTYTPRRFDAAANRLEIEFVRHGDGLASNWAETAKIGDRVLIGGPGGGYVAPEGIRRLIIVADESAMPGAGMVVEALPEGCLAQAICEIAGPAEERPLSPTAPCDVRWLHRDPKATPCAALENAIASMSDVPADAHFWVACEAAAMRRIRDVLTTKFGVERARLHTRGYWKFGDTNYPDHDYGAE